MRLPFPTCPGPLAAGHPLAGFYATLVGLPASHPRRVGLAIMQLGMVLALPALCFGLAVMHICCGVAAVGAILALPPVHRLPGFSWALAFTIWQCASALTVLLLHRHPHPLGGIGMMYTWVALYLAQVAFIAPVVRTWACRCLLIAVAISAALAVLQFTVGAGGAPPFHVAAPPRGVRFRHSTGFSPVHLTQAFTMAMVALVFLYQPTVDPSAGRARRWAGALIAAVGLVLANARLAFLATSAGIAAGIAALGGRRVAAGIAVGTALLAVFAAGQYLLAPAYLTEALRGEDGRLAIWRTAGAMIADAPLVGSGGAEAFKPDYKKHYRAQPGDPPPTELVAEAPHAHNSELSIAAVHGLPATLFHLAWITALLAAAWRSRVAHPAAWSLSCALVATFMVAGLFEDLAGHSAPAYVFAITMGLAASLIALPRTAPTTSVS